MGINERHNGEDDDLLEVSTEKRLTKLETNQESILEKVTRIDGKIDGLGQTFVTHVEFWPVKAIVFTGAGAVLLAVLGAVVGLVIIAAQ